MKKNKKIEYIRIATAVYPSTVTDLELVTYEIVKEFTKRKGTHHTLKDLVAKNLRTPIVKVGALDSLVKNITLTDEPAEIVTGNMVIGAEGVVIWKDYVISEIVDPAFNEFFEWMILDVGCSKLEGISNHIVECGLYKFDNAGWVITADSDLGARIIRNKLTTVLRESYSQGAGEFDLLSMSPHSDLIKYRKSGSLVINKEVYAPAIKSKVFAVEDRSEHYMESKITSCFDSPLVAFINLMLQTQSCYSIVGKSDHESHIQINNRGTGGYALIHLPDESADSLKAKVILKLKTAFHGTDEHFQLLYNLVVEKGERGDHLLDCDMTELSTIYENPIKVVEAEYLIHNQMPGTGNFDFLSIVETELGRELLLTLNETASRYELMNNITGFTILSLKVDRSFDSEEVFTEFISDVRGLYVKKYLLEGGFRVDLLTKLTIELNVSMFAVDTLSLSQVYDYYERSCGSSNVEMSDKLYNDLLLTFTLIINNFLANPIISNKGLVWLNDLEGEQQGLIKSEVESLMVKINDVKTLDTFDHSSRISVMVSVYEYLKESKFFKIGD